MREIPLTLSIPTPDKPLTAADILEVVIRDPGERGLSTHDLITAVRLDRELQAAAAAGGPLRLEDSDWSFLVGRLDTIRWRVVLPELAAFLEQIKAAPAVPLNGPSEAPAG